MRDIGRNIRDLRTKKGLTQDQLAEKLFCTRQTLSNYERGISRPDIETLERIASALEADVTQLLYGTEDMRNRSRARIVLGVGLALTVLLAVAYVLLDRWTFAIRSTRYLMGPNATVRLLGRPVLCLVAGWTLMQGVSLLGRFLTPKGKALRIMRAALVTVVLLFLFCLLPGILAFWGLPVPLFLNRLGTALAYAMLGRWSGLWLLFFGLMGMAFRFAAFPGDGEKPRNSGFSSALEKTLPESKKNA